MFWVRNCKLFSLQMLFLKSVFIWLRTFHCMFCTKRKQFFIVSLHCIHLNSTFAIKHWKLLYIPTYCFLKYKYSMISICSRNIRIDKFMKWIRNFSFNMHTWYWCPLQLSHKNKKKKRNNLDMATQEIVLITKMHFFLYIEICDIDLFVILELQKQPK